MFFKNLKYGLRNLLFNKFDTLIKIIGLAVGFGASFLIFLHIVNELSFDQFHEDSNQIYRLSWESQTVGSRLVKIPEMPVSQLVSKYPEIKNGVRFYRPEYTALLANKKKFKEKNFFYADETFNKIFSVSFLEGNPSKALEKPNSIILTKETAIKYYGTTQVIGKTIKNNEGITFTISGVVESFPKESHFHFNAVASYSTLPKAKNPWQRQGYLYLKIKSESSAKELEKKLNKLSRTGYVSWFRQFKEIHFLLQPITNIHLHSSYDGEIEKNSNIKFIYLLAVIAILLLVIASINYINLSTARYSKRYKEIGLKKTFGATQPNLFFQFIIESILISFSSFILALGLSKISLPVFNNVFNKDLNIFIYSNIFEILAFTVIVIVVGFVAGLYPSLYLSKFSPSSIFNNNKSSLKNTFPLRKTLVAVQFLIASILIIVSYTINEQLQFLLEKDVGFKTENVLAIPTRDLPQKKVGVLKDEIQRLSGVQNVTFVEGTPFRHGKKIKATEGGNKVVLNYIRVDHKFLSTLGLQVIKGSNFHQGSRIKNGILINRMAQNKLNLSNPIGKILGPPLKGKRVIGIVDDFNTSSLHNEIEPMIFYHKGYKQNAQHLQHLLVRKNDHNPIASVKEIWSNLVDRYPFEYTFFDSQWESLYEEESNLKKIINFFSYLIIIISSLGILGLAVFSMESRKKEIAIRKTLGAQSSSIFKLLASDLLKPILLSYLFGSLISYYILNQWLSNFAYKIDLGLGLFLVSGVIVTALVTVTISYHLIQASLLNPVDNLR